MKYKANTSNKMKSIIENYVFNKARVSESMDWNFNVNGKETGSFHAWLAILVKRLYNTRVVFDYIIPMVLDFWVTKYLTLGPRKSDVDSQ